MATAVRVWGSPEMHAQVVALYKRGYSIRCIQSMTPYGYGSVWNILTDAGVRLRSRGFPNGTRYEAAR